mmetsp:Transcript_48330/g.114913  ORF Transcript_48330/g.114913 Transcript_48330/m.114913 type:complete len:212 (-) Transcript_48330:187-822(-)
MYILLRCVTMLSLIEELPNVAIGTVELTVGRSTCVLHPMLIRELALHKIGQQSAEVACHVLASGVQQVISEATNVVKEALVRICRVGAILRFVLSISKQPTRLRSKIQDDGVVAAIHRIHKVLQHGHYVGKIPRCSLAVHWRIQLRNALLWVWIPRYVADQICLQRCKGCPRVLVDGVWERLPVRPCECAVEDRIGHHLQRGHSARLSDDL